MNEIDEAATSETREQLLRTSKTLASLISLIAQSANSPISRDDAVTLLNRLIGR
jgi:hypothetical protein